MKRAEHQPEETEVALYAGVFVKVWSVQDAGTLIPQHAHAFDHMTLVMRGAVRVWRDDEMTGDVHAPAIIRVPAHTMHRFLALTSGCVLACIHNVDHLDAADEPAVAALHALKLED